MIEHDEKIVDNTCMQLVMNPQQFDVMLMGNLYGDIVSNLAAGLVGGLGIVPAARIGDGYAVFEVKHGTAPNYADKDVVNPTAMLLCGCMMFEHLGWKDVAKTIESAFAKTIQQKKVTVTPDLARVMTDGTELKTSEFAKAIVGNM